MNTTTTATRVARCTCGKPAQPRDDTCGDRRCVAYAIALDTAAARREDR